MGLWNLGWIKYLRLHNKPKAAVLAGTFMLTGPRQEEEILPYFPAYKTHYFPRKMWPKFELRLIRRG
jgi:hypothetical protein